MSILQLSITNFKYLIIKIKLKIGLERLELSHTGSKYQGPTN